MADRCKGDLAGTPGESLEDMQQNLPEGTSGAGDVGDASLGAVDSARPPPSPIRRIRQRCADIIDNNTGLLLIALSQAFASLMGVFVKLLNASEKPVPPVELIWVRMVMTWIACVIYMTISNVPDPILGPRGIRFLLAFRGLAGFVGLFGTYFALQYLSLSDTTVLSFLTPMSTAITGAVLLKEDLGAKQVLASGFSFVGVILIARPHFLFGQAPEGSDDSGTEKTVTPAQRLTAVGVALLGVVGLTAVFTTIRAIGKRAHPMHNVAAFALVSIVVGPIMMLATRTQYVIPDDLYTMAMVIGVSLSGFAAQMCMTTGLQRETAGRGTMAMYVQVVFALLFQRIFFHSVPPPLSLLGTAIILSSAIYVVLSKRATSAKEEPGRGAALRNNESQTLERGLLEVDPDEEEHKLDSIERGP